MHRCWTHKGISRAFFLQILAGGRSFLGKSLDTRTQRYFERPIFSTASHSLHTVSFRPLRSFSGQTFASCKIRRQLLLPQHNHTHLRTTHSVAHMERNGNGTSAVKRKASPVAGIERPKKQMKPGSYSILDGDDIAAQTSHQRGDPSGYTTDSEDGDAKILPLVAAAADTAEWQATIERVVRNVVSIHFCQTCAFDTDAACSSEATGFVVDAERGYILTNRHVACAGPFWGYCIFDNHEEVSAP